MEKERAIDKLRKGQKVICATCGKHFYDNSFPNYKTANYFHCEDPNCKGYVHEQKAINVE